MKICNKSISADSMGSVVIAPPGLKLVGTSPRRRSIYGDFVQQ